MADQNGTGSPEVKVDGHALLEAMEQNGWEFHSIEILHKETGIIAQFDRNLLLNKKDLADVLREVALRLPKIKGLVTSMAFLPCTPRNGWLN